MCASAPGSQKILTYGHDPVLLETRRMLLAKNGFDVEAAAKEEEFHVCLSRSARPYGLWILCHTIPNAERSAVKELAAKTNTPVFQLETAIAPPDFLAKVKEALGQ